MRFVFKQVDSWPPLAWLARVQHAQEVITVWHGSRVECSDDGFCEAVWDGDFSAMDFDRTDLIFGSGCRLRNNRATFVSSGSTVDRLHLYRSGGSTDVSNSLACISEFNSLSFDPTYPHYRTDFTSIQHGLEKVVTDVQTSGGPVTLVYYRNVVWNGKSLTYEDKRFGDRRFADFAGFKGFLTEGMASLAANMKSDSRHYKYEPLGTLSSSYDSSMVAVLIRDIECRRVICFRKARGGESDDGSQTADRIGLEAIAANRDGWRQQGMAAVPFLASNGNGEEVQYAAVADHLHGKVLFTGFHGDVVWGKQVLDKGDSIVRGDCTGMSLTEFRLWHGFVHCPVPFWGARNVVDINAIGNSDEMKAWDVPGDYSRPICRRIVESAGVPREFFGMKKRATSVIFRSRQVQSRQDRILSPETAASFADWLRRHRSLWLRKGKLPPEWRPDIFDMKGITPIVTQILHMLRRLRLRRAAVRLDALRIGPTFLFLFPWAMHQAKQRYRVAFSSEGETKSDSVS